MYNIIQYRWLHLAQINTIILKIRKDSHKVVTAEKKSVTLRLCKFEGIALVRRHPAGAI